MQIYDGSGDKTVFPTNHTVTVISAGCVPAITHDHMTLRRNGRADWSVLYCETGKLTVEHRILEAGQLWIYPPDVPQQYITYSRDKTVYRYLHFTGSDVSGLMSSLEIAPLTPIAVRYSRISALFDSIQNSMNDESTLSKLEAEYHTLHLLAQIARRKTSRSESGMMKRVTDNMEHDFSSAYDAARYASMLNISTSRFNHLFTECTGQSPYAFYLQLRMENAANLLEVTNLQIKDIARQCGFEDPLYFTQAFKRTYGLTPSAYRKSCRPLR